MAIKEIVGVITYEESMNIKYLNSRKDALIDLLPTLKTSKKYNILYKKVEKELDDITKKNEEWWNLKKKQYNWPEGELYVRYDNSKVYLLK